MLLEHGFTNADLESGRITIGEAELLMEDMKLLISAVEGADDRLITHYENEQKRIKAGLKTDMERLEDGELTRD